MGVPAPNKPGKTPWGYARGHMRCDSQYLRWVRATTRPGFARPHPEVGQPRGQSRVNPGSGPGKARAGGPIGQVNPGIQGITEGMARG